MISGFAYNGQFREALLAVRFIDLQKPDEADPIIFCVNFLGLLLQLFSTLYYCNFCLYIFLTIYLYISKPWFLHGHYRPRGFCNLQFSLFAFQICSRSLICFLNSAGTALIATDTFLLLQKLHIDLSVHADILLDW
ncbi:hypothetical protein ACJX0J_039969, partial [Zea mays]